MAQINEYTPQVETPGPVGGVSPNVELAGAVGRSIENFGKEVTQSGEKIHQRISQEETADVYSNIANLRYQKNQELQQKIQDGSLDVDQFSQDYDNEMNDIGSNLSTPEGQNYFERQSSRLKGQLLKTAMSGQAQIAARVAMSSWQDSINKDSLTIKNDPMQFEDIHDSMQEHVDSLIKTGGLPAKMRDQAVKEADTQYAEAALIGRAQIYGPEAAKVMMNKGGLGEYLTVEQREKVESHIDQAGRSNAVEQERVTKAVKDAQELVAEKWGQDHLEKLTNNALSTKDVLSAVQGGTLKWEQGERWLNMIKAGTKQDAKSDPRVFNQLVQRIANPESESPIAGKEDLMPFVANGKISVQDFAKLNSLIDKTPDGQATKQGEKALFDTMAKTIRFKNQMTGQYDLMGEQKLAQAKSDYIQAKKALPQGIKPQELVDPNSPLYFGNRLNAYQTSLKDQMSSMNQDRTNKALGLRPTGQNPNPTPVNQARKPNESAADYLKRIGK